MNDRHGSEGLAIRLEVRSTDPLRSTPQLIEEIQRLGPQLANHLPAAEVQIQREQALPLSVETQVILVEIGKYIGPIVLGEVTKRVVKFLLDEVQDAILKPIEEPENSGKARPER